MTATRTPANLPRRSSGRLAFTARTPAGELVYLTAQQRALLFVLHAHIRRGRRVRLTTRALAELAGYSHPGNVTRALDRLASFGLIGRHAIRGRRGHVRVWSTTRAGAARRVPVGNVAASTPFGGYITREALERTWSRHRSQGTRAVHPPTAAADGRPGTSSWPPTAVRPADPSLGRDRRTRRPPRVLYTRCPNGHQTRIGRRWWRASFLELEAEWSGRCHRCGLEAIERVTLAAAGGQLRAPVGSAPWRAELESRHGGERVAAFLEALRLEIEAGGAVHPAAPLGRVHDPRPAASGQLE